MGILDMITTLTAHTLPGVYGVSVTASGDTLTTLVSTGTIVYDLDTAQYQNDEGPCVEAARSGETQYAQDEEISSRWPAFSKAVATHPIVAILSLPLTAPNTTDTLGALNIYGRNPFDAVATWRGLSFAQLAAAIVAALAS
jgi:hypothetical protein